MTITKATLTRTNELVITTDGGDNNDNNDAHDNIGNNVEAVVVRNHRHAPSCPFTDT